ncbi:DUF305 domain-containing protein [Pseudonocardia spirodelae]|uniref:DUF305 domain-containing protein n=1 Tax=Pseudonocardia spirodelae TaxID=3133431 RepID=A0ABU8T2D8_9PSEU
MNRTTVAAAATALTAALVLAGCAGTTGTATGTTAVPAAPTAGAAAHTEADVVFAQGMIPHHRQAVSMAQLADGRAGDEVRALAGRIESAQGPEIAQLQGMLAAWGAPETAAGDHAAHGPMAGMAGMAGDREMAALGRASGPAFDRMFLQLMIAHHEGAVAMAGDELGAGADPGARALAQRIVDAQRAEIAEMRALLG